MLARFRPTLVEIEIAPRSADSGSSRNWADLSRNQPYLEIARPRSPAPGHLEGQLTTRGQLLLWTLGPTGWTSRHRVQAALASLPASLPPRRDGHPYCGGGCLEARIPPRAISAIHRAWAEVEHPWRQVGLISPESGPDLGPESAQVCPMSAKVGKQRPGIDQFRPNLAQNWSNVGLASTKGGPNWSNVGPM